MNLLPATQGRCPACGQLPQARERWIVCAERLPPLDTIVLVDGGIACWRGGHWDSCTMQVRAIEWEVTHWMPLPEGPKT